MEKELGIAVTETLGKHSETFVTQVALVCEEAVEADRLATRSC